MYIFGFPNQIDFLLMPLPGLCKSPAYVTYFPPPSRFGPTSRLQALPPVSLTPPCLVVLCSYVQPTEYFTRIQGCIAAFSLRNMEGYTRFHAIPPIFRCYICRPIDADAAPARTGFYFKTNLSFPHALWQMVQGTLGARPVRVLFWPH